MGMSRRHRAGIATTNSFILQVVLTMAYLQHKAFYCRDPGSMFNYEVHRGAHNEYGPF